MRALAWDDEPEDYFEELREHLEGLGIEMQIESDPGRVPPLLDSERWDFVITDVLNEKDSSQDGPPMGVRIGEIVGEKGLPLFVFTGIPSPENLRKQFPRSTEIHSKRTPPAFAAYEIKRDLRRRGLWTDRRKVFLIYGHDHESSSASKVVREWLMKWGLTIGEISSDSMTATIVEDLLTEMSDSAAVLAVCTPDDEVVVDGGRDTRRQPRQNVLLEIGMAMGLAGGLTKLTFLQKWDEGRMEAVLPSDLGGVLTMRFKNSVDECGTKVEKRLRDLGVLIPDS